MNRLIATLLFALLVLAVPAQSLDLKQAKAQGLVGETLTGYLAPVQNSPEVQKLVETINAKRREMYKKIAAKRGISLAAVEKLAGKKAIEKTPPGQFINLGKGWQRK